MKNMLIAASVLGATIAGLILYSQRRSKGGNKVVNAAKDAYYMMNKGIASVERPAHHSMG